MWPLQQGQLFILITIDLHISISLLQNPFEDAALVCDHLKLNVQICEKLFFPESVPVEKTELLECEPTSTGRTSDN